MKQITIDDILPHVRKNANKELRDMEEKFWDETWDKKYISNYAKGLYLTYINYIRNCEHYDIPYNARQKEVVKGWYDKFKEV